MSDVTPEELRTASAFCGFHTSDLLQRAADTIERLTDKPQQPAVEFVRVRLPIHVSPYGEWVSHWWQCYNDETSHRPPLNKGCVELWITADIPLPKPLEITATVEPA